MTAEFTHLHLHSLYSLLDGAIRMDDLIKTVRERGMKSVAVTDHGNMFGVVDFYKKARAGGVKPILGCEVYVAGPKGRRDKSERIGHHLILLAENLTGYKNLRYLCSMGFLEGFYYDPRVDKDLLAKHSEGIFALTACMAGEVPRAARRGDMDGARRAALELKQIFQPDHFFLEIQSNDLPEQRQVNDHLAELSRDVDVPLIATADAHYVSPEQARAHEVLMCIASGKTLEDQRRLKHETEQLYIKRPEEMATYFSDRIEAVHNTQRVMEACNVELDLKSTFLPQFQVPEGEDLESYLQKRARAGLAQRFSELPYPVDQDRYQERLETELKVIVKMGFAGYFLIVQDFINWAKGRGIPVGPGRGSGAGSIVAWSLRITDLDPLPYNLLFERFLNPERVSMPDFDVDFCQDRRGEVIEYVTEKYGKDNVGQIITFGSLKARSVIRDVVRVMGLSFAEGDRIAKLVPEVLNITLREAIEQEPRLRALMEEKPEYKEALDIAQALEGLHRNAGMHAAGVVIAENPLWEYVPVYRGQNGELVTQFAKDEVEQAGLVKFDFLGLKTLTVIDEAVKLANRSRPEPVDLARMGFDDPAVYALIARGDTDGVFQMESSGFTEMVKKMKPSRFEDIIAAGALYRPGPLDQKLEDGRTMVDVYIDRKHGREKVRYPHPKLQPVLEETYGVIVYQEQVMQISQILGGYSLGRADLLRRAMGKKKADVMAKERSGFLEGCGKSGVDPRVAGEIFDLMEKFAAYGFNKSHSAAYGVLTYQTAWLKAHHPVEFMAALLTSVRDDTDKVVAHIAEARAMGIEVLPPDVNESDQQFGVARAATSSTEAGAAQAAGSMRGGKIRFGLGAIKGVGEAAIEAILAARGGEGGPFRGLFDFCARVDLRKLNKKVLEALVAAGAFDFARAPRRALMMSIDGAMEQGAQAQRDRAVGQKSLFDLLGGGASAGPAHVEERYEPVEEYPERERLSLEKSALGFYITGHPLDRYAADLKRYATHTCAGLGQARPYERAAVAGIVAVLRERPTKTGKRIAFVTLEDLTGTREIIVFHDLLEKSEALLRSEEPLLFRGQTQERRGMNDDEAPTVELKCEEVVRLADVRALKTSRLEVRVEAARLTPERAERLRELLAASPGTCEVSILAYTPRAEARVSLRSYPVQPSDDLLAAVDRLFGARVAALR